MAGLKEGWGDGFHCVKVKWKKDVCLITSA